MKSSENIGLDRSAKFVTADITPDEQRGLHRVLIGLATFFFIWLVLEGVFLVPVLFSRYGLH